MQVFAQSEPTAARRTVVFKLVDRTDNLTPETGIVLTGSEIQVSKNGAAFVDFAGTAAEIAGGYYSYEFAVAELDTVGNVRLKVDDAAAAIVVEEYEVRTIEQVYIDLYDGAIWIDGAVGAAGSVLGVNGTRTNPVSTVTDAKTLADALGVKVYRLLGNTSISITADHIGWTFIGTQGTGAFGFPNVDVDLAADVGGSRFIDCHCTGQLLATTGSLFVERGFCTFSNIIIPVTLEDTVIGSMTASAPGFLLMHNCLGFLGATLSLNDAAVVATKLRGELTIGCAPGATVDIQLDDDTKLSAGAVTGGDWTVRGHGEVLGAGLASLDLLDDRRREYLASLYDGAVYVSAGVTNSGTVLGVDGTIDNPLDNMTDAKSLQVKLQGLGVVIEAIRVLESGIVFNIAGTYSGGAFVLEGAGAASGLLGGQTPQVNVNSGADVNGSAFRGLAFTGGSSDFGDITGDGVALSNCSISADLGWEGVLTLFDCTISQPIELVQGAAKFIQALLASRCSLFDVTINNDDNDATAVLFECTGTVRLENHSTAGAGLSSFGGQGLIVDLQPTVSDGVFNFTGLNSIIDQKTGGVVNKAAFIDEASLGQHVLIDQREYVTDGTQKLMVKARRSTFLSEADLLAVTPDTTGPFTEGKHPAAIKTQYVETTPGAAANEPEAFKVRTI